MAVLLPELWRYNLARVVVVDVTDDYGTLRQPLPSDYYPVLREVWVTHHDIERRLAQIELVDGYLYDWHQGPQTEGGPWFVGVVDRGLVTADACPGT